VRAWFVAGQPAPRRGVSFGSFEDWQRTVGGIADHAGQHGILDNLRQWRSESDFARAYWSAHLRWLRRTFGTDEFMISQVVERLRTDLFAEHPPNMDDAAAKGYPRQLGQAYAKQQDRHLDGLRLAKSGTGHNNAIKWRVRDGDDPCTQALTPAPGSDQSTEVAEAARHTSEQAPGPIPNPILGGNGGNGGDPQPPPYARETTHTRDTRTHIFSRTRDAREVPPVTPVTPARSAIDPLLHLAVDRPPRTCRECGGPCLPVPPAHFWFACPACFPATFTRD
jgi:hypothetical protein